MPAKLEELTGEVASVRWPMPDPESRFVVGSLTDNTLIAGEADRGDLMAGLSYTLYGHWSDYQGQRQFRFRQAKKEQPATRHGVITYLCKYADGIGPSLAARLYDVFGADAVKALRLDPNTAAERVRGLRSDVAATAARCLEADAKLEDTRIALTDMFHGRGFPGALVEDCIKTWGIHAPNVIKRDPFKLLVKRFRGCGFLRCDRLYCDLGLPPARTKRQCLAAWYSVREASDRHGHTWHPVKWVFGQIVNLCGSRGQRIEKAVRLGIRAGWLSVRNRSWIAEAAKGRSERVIAEKL